MKVTVCCITYNHEKFIREALEGFLMQRFSEPWDIVVSDDASTDGTPGILKEYQKRYPDRIRLLLNESNIGMMPNFIKVLKASNAEYTAFCEGDDYWTDPYKLQKQVTFLSSHPDFSCCCHHVRYLSDGRKTKNFNWDAPSESDLRYLLQKGNYFATLSVVFRNDPKVTDFVEKFPQAPLGDFILYVAAAHLGKIKILEDAMGVYRIHAGGIWSQNGEKVIFDKFLSVLDLLFDELDEKYHDDLRIHAIRMIEFHFRLTKKYRIADNPKLDRLLTRFGVPNYIERYLQFISEERCRPSYFSKHVPIKVLLKALRLKIARKVRL